MTESLPLFPPIENRHRFPSSFHVEAHMLDAHGVSFAIRPSLADAHIAHAEAHASGSLRFAHTHGDEPLPVEELETITAQNIADRLHANAAADENVIVNQTGGGVATIYVGEPVEVEDWGPTYRLVIGPGSFDWHEPMASEFSFVELCISPDYAGGVEPSDPYAYVTTWDEFDAACERFLTTPDGPS